MSKSKILRNAMNGAQVEQATFNYYSRKYFSLFLNRFKFKGIDYQQADFIMRKMWIDGTICAFKIPETIGSTEHPQGQLVFVTYAPNGWNIYDFPISVEYINPKGVKFIPTGSHTIDKDCVIGWCQRNKYSVKAMVDYYIQKIVNIEMVIDINLNAHKMPFIIGCAPEDTRKFEEILRLLRENNPDLFVESDDVDRLKVLVSGAPYILDKLYNLKHAIENELKEYLGLNNLGSSEKKEHLITSEVDVNNEIIEEHRGNFIDCMAEFFERIRDVLGVDVSIEINEDLEYNENMEEEQDEEMED